MSNTNDSLNLSGNLHIIKYDVNMNIVEERHVKNLVVTAGKNLIATLVTGASSTTVGYMAVGTGSTAPAAADTTLGTEVARVALTTKNAANNVMSFVGIFNPGVGTGTLQEGGLFTAASAGTMLCRSTFSSITKGVSDTVSITWTVTIS